MQIWTGKNFFKSLERNRSNFNWIFVKMAFEMDVNRWILFWRRTFRKHVGEVSSVNKFMEVGNFTVHLKNSEYMSFCGVEHSWIKQKATRRKGHSIHGWSRPGTKLKVTEIKFWKKWRIQALHEGTNYDLTPAPVSDFSREFESWDFFDKCLIFKDWQII